jgi:hypothetical protein
MAALTASSERGKHSMVSARRFTAGDKNFTFRDIETQRSLRDQPHDTLTKLPTATKICPTPRDSLLASMNEYGVKRGLHESQYRDRLHSG